MRLELWKDFTESLKTCQLHKNISQVLQILRELYQHANQNRSQHSSCSVVPSDLNYLSSYSPE